jgi:ribosomal protein S18 acetylase RimI-like enzyme
MTDDRAATVLEVRPLVADDWAQLRQARLAALTEAPYAFASTLGREQAFTDEHWRDRAASGRTFGAFQDAILVGLATGFLAHAGQTAAAPGDRQPQWELVGMWVAPSFRGQSVGDRLVDAVCERAREAGALTVTLWVTEVNHRAAAFYRRLGFVPTGVRQPVWPDEPDRWEEELARSLR